MSDQQFQLIPALRTGLNRKIFHIGDRCYTENKILIYSIYVTNSWSNIEKLFEYFSQYGKIDNLYILETTNKFSDSDEFKANAVIQYLQPESAALALCDSKTYTIHKIIVTNVESAKQPYQQHFQNYQIIQNNDDALHCQLNFDCLYLIFTYLPVKDQIKMSLLSNNFKEILRKYYKKRSLKINDSRIIFMEMRQILFEIGENFEKVELLGLAGGRFFTLILKFCPNINEFRIQELELLYNNLGQDISKNMRSLKILKIINCNLKNDDIEMLSSISENISSLDLTGNRQITGDYLERFINLKVLILRGCHKIEKNIFYKMRRNYSSIEFLELDVITIKCKNMDGDIAYNIGQLKDLNALHIHDSVGYNRNALEEIYSFLNQLTDTNMINQLINIKIPFLANARIDVIFKFINLEIFDIQRFDSNSCSPKFWRNLTMLKNLKCFNAKINDSLNEIEFLNFIRNSKNIEYVKVLGGPSALYMEFILRVIAVLKKKVKSKTLVIWRKSICKTEFMKINQHPEFYNNHTLIKLKVDCMY